MSVEVARFGARECAVTHLMPDVCGYHVLRILAVAVCRIGDVCCFLAPAHQPFLFNNLDLRAPEEACRRNVRAPGTLKFGYEDIFKISTRKRKLGFILGYFTFTLGYWIFVKKYVGVFKKMIQGYGIFGGRLERAGLYASRAFVRLSCMRNVCHFPLPLSAMVAATCDCSTPWTFHLTVCS